MKKFKVPCSWEMYGTMYVEADSQEEAINKADDLPLPTDGYYIEDSFRVDEEVVEEI